MSLRNGIILLSVLIVLAAVNLAGCPAPTTGGDAIAGQADFLEMCVSCHDPASVAAARGLVRENMGTINPAMNGITLTASEVADIQAYLATQ